MRHSAIAPQRARRRATSPSPRIRPSLEALEERTLLTLQAVSLANPALFGASADGLSGGPSISADGQLVAFRSSADNLVDNPTSGFNEQVYVGDVTGGSTRLVSANAAGAGGNGESTDPVLSADGRFVVFLSDATDLVPLQVTGGMHLYETDLQTGTTTLVDVNTSGAGTADNVDTPSASADGAYTVLNPPSVSADGRYVVFTAAATNLASGTTVSSGTITNVYVRDMVAGTTTLVSVNAAGGDGGNGNSATATISADGSEVVFQSDASNLVATDTNNATDVFVRNLKTGVTSLVSANQSNADSGDFESYGPVLSGDGNHVVFLSHADDLQSVHKHNLVVDVYERNLTTGVTTLISVNTAGTDSIISNASEPSVSPDGRYVAFVDEGPPQVFVRDTQAGTTVVASINAAGTAGGDSNSTEPTLSADGHVVAFLSVADNLVSLPTHGLPNVFVRNLMTGVTTLVSINAAGTAGGDSGSESTSESSNFLNGPVVLTPDGTKVAFVSLADDLVANDNNHLADVFARDLNAGTTTLVSPRAPTQPAAYTSHGPTYLGALSADGNEVAMNGGGPDLVATNQSGLIFATSSASVRDLQAGSLFAPAPNNSGAASLSADGSVLAFQENGFSNGGIFKNVYTAAVPGGAPVLASVNAAGTDPGNANSFSPVISGDGSTVVFTSAATDLIPGFVRGTSATNVTGTDLFARDLRTGVTTLVSVNAEGTAGGDGLSGDSGGFNLDMSNLSNDFGGYGYTLSADGRYVAFSSEADDLTSIKTKGGGSIYVRDLQAGTTQLVDVAADGTSPANGPSFNPVISADGRYVVFASRATNLVAGINFPADLAGSNFIYVRDLQAETTRLVSVDPLGNPISTAQVASISADGQVITFFGIRSDNPGGATNADYAFDMTTGQLQLVSVNASGDVADIPGNAYQTQGEFEPVVSADGRFVAFLSTADNLAPGTFDGSENLYLRNLQAGTTTLVSANRFGTGGGTVLPQNRQSDPIPGVNNFAINADGSTVAFSSDQYDLVQGESLPASNVFVYHPDTTPPMVGAISGQAFDDLNGNGTLDRGENGLAGLTVYLDIGNLGHFVPGDPSTLTDASGNYSFSNLTPGTYTVAEVIPPGDTQTAPASPGTQTVTVNAGQTTAGPSFGDQTLSADLTVQSINVPTVIAPGQAATSISYTVVNQGGGAALGDLQDAVYLSTGTTIDASSTLLAVEAHAGGLAAGASYTASLGDVTIPALASGNYHVLVQVDRRGQVVEPASAKADETGASTQTVALSVPTLTVGTPTVGAFSAAGQVEFYQLTVAAGENLLLTLESGAASGTLSLAERFGLLPVSGSTDETTVGTAGPNQTLGISPTQAGTYFIDVHSESGAAASAAFTLTATTPALDLFSASPTAVGNAGPSTITIDGLGLTPATQYSLVGTGGAIAAQSASFTSGSQAFATFNLAGAAAGSYTVQAKAADGTITTLPGAITVKAGVGPHLVASISGPADVRPGRIYAFTVTYANTGDADMAAPLLQVVSSTDTLMGLTPEGLADNGNLQVLATSPSGPAGVLRPGDSGSVTVFFQPTVVAPTFAVSANTTDDPTPMDYSQLSAVLQPPDLTDSQWSAVFARFQAMVGPTSGDYVRMLAENATLLPPSLGDARDPIALADLEVRRAEASVGTSIAGALGTTDPQVSLAGRTVVATNTATGDEFATTSLNDGTFLFEAMTPGSYTFQVDQAVEAAVPPITVAAGQAVQGESLSLSLGGVITGQITSAATLLPVGGATVEAISGGTFVTGTTDPDGRYRLEGLPQGTYEVLALAPGLAQQAVTGLAVAGAGDSQSADIALPAQAVITGTVALGSGGPTGGTVTVFAVPTGGTDPSLVFPGTVTGDSYTIPNLPAGTYDVTVAVVGYVSQTIAGVAATGPTQSAGMVVLPVSASISGFVSADQPADLLIGAYEGTDLIATTVSDDAGNFKFNSLPAGTYTLNLIAPQSVPNPPTVVLAANQSVTGIEIVVPPNGTVLDPGVVLLLDQIRLTIADAQQLQIQCAGQIDALNKLLASLDANQCPEAQAEYDKARKAVGDVLEHFDNLSQKLNALIISLNKTLELGATDPATAQDNFDVLTDLLADDYQEYQDDLGEEARARGAVDAFFAAVVEKCQMPLKPPPPSPQPPPQPPGGDGNFSAFVVNSNDPNEKTGPGAGASGFVAAGAVMPYSVTFENDPAQATAAAQEVTVTDPLSPNLDWTTFTLGDISFGANFIAVPAGLQSYTTSVDTTNTDGTPLRVDVSAGIDLATGVVTWTFRSVDPATGQLPIGVQDGFLPIDDGSGRGMGTVYYDVKPLAGLATGTSFTNTASVIFDTNAPVVTDTVTNTIDAGAPTSTVAALPVTAGVSFPVTWAGSDDTGGSGIASYNVYVSDNGGTFTPWLTGTTETSATYPGAYGHAYGFYSVATDNVGNVQPSPTVAQATTQVVATPLQVTSISPSANFLTSLPDDQIVVTFNRPLAGLVADKTDGTGFANTPFAVMLIPSGPDGLATQKATGVFWSAPAGDDSGDLPIPATAVYHVNSDGTSTITLTPDQPLATDIYLITVNGLSDAFGDPLAKDAAGDPGNVYASFDYRPTAVNLNAPTVTAVTANNGSVVINNDQIPQPDTIGIRFSKPMDTYTMNTSTVQLFQKGVAGALLAAVAYSPTTQSAYLTPETKLVPGALYFVSVAANVTDDQGFPSPGVPLGQAFATSFTVSSAAAGSGTSPLTVVKTNPLDRKEWTLPLGYGAVTFSEPIDLSTLGRFSAMLVPQTGSAVRGAGAYADVPVDAKLAFNPNTNQLIIVPTGALPNDTIYLFELSDITATNGDALAGTVFATFLLNNAATPQAVERASVRAPEVALPAASGTSVAPAEEPRVAARTVAVTSRATIRPPQAVSVARSTPPAGPLALTARRGAKSAWNPARTS